MREIQVCLHSFAKVKTIHLRHHHVRNYDVNPACFQLCYCLLAVARCLYSKRLTYLVGEELAHTIVVFYYKYRIATCSLLYLVRVFFKHIVGRFQCLHIVLFNTLFVDRYFHHKRVLVLIIFFEHQYATKQLCQ